jgi:glycosyltransferase involved in cell wall biosynthesis
MAAARLTAIVPLRGGDADFDALEGYRRILEDRGEQFQMVLVFDRRDGALAERLRSLKAGDPRILLLGLSRWQGEAAAVATALGYAEGEVILTLPGHAQVEAAGIHAVIDARGDADLVIGRRAFPAGRAPKLVQARLFHRLVEWLFGTPLNDLGCRVRACRRPVLEETGAYGTQWRFLPLIAAQRGFSVKEIEVAPGLHGGLARLNPLDYARRFFDVLALFLLLKFTKRPLRFFGPFGFGILAAGLTATAALVGSRLWLDVALADRPALVLATLMVVLGIQVIALGLIGEIIIFAAGKRIKDYIVEKVL